MRNIAIFASGNGTNAENISRYFASSDAIHVALVLSNHAKAGGHARVQALGVPSSAFPDLAWNSCRRTRWSTLSWPGS